ncbi:MAG: cytochrome c [Gammaproteobacteria bacterium]|nr:cytochrome c [Gammaproteobacteria bacterium]
MRRGEKLILGGMAVLIVGLMVKNYIAFSSTPSHEKSIPFYSTASKELTIAGDAIYKAQNCKKCHSLWTIKNIMATVPAPMLDGIGSLRSEKWLLDYFSAGDPQKILKGRLKAEWSMPSYSHLPQQDRETLAAYMASLKVEDWYLEDLKKLEYKKLTGNEWPAEDAKDKQ